MDRICPNQTALIITVIFVCVYACVKLHNLCKVKTTLSESTEESWLASLNFYLHSELEISVSRNEQTSCMIAQW